MLQVLGTIFNVAALWYLSRRLLNVPIGWGRTVLVSVIVNAWGFRVLEHLLAALGASDQTPVHVLVLFSLLMAGWAVTFELIALTILEALLPTRAVPSVVAVVRGLPSWWRRSRRYLQIWWILVRHGLAAYLGPSQDAAGQDVPRVARSLRLALTEGDVTFVKLGQMISTRPDLVPQTFVDELSHLHSSVPPVPWRLVEPHLTAALGAPAEEVFATFDTTAFAAASTAQIHAATLVTGEEVVVKVRRPGALTQVRADLDIVTRLARRLEERTTWGRRLGVVSLAEGFAESIEEELNYRDELLNMQALACGALRVPRAYPEYSSERVIVMERIDGLPVSRSAEVIAGLTAERRAELARELFSGVLRQVMVTGVFHADLHPGNILLTEQGLTLLDFGSVGRLDRATRAALGSLLLAVEHEDALTATDALISIMDRPDGLSERALEREIGQLILRHGAGGTGSDALFAALMGVVLRHGFHVPPQLAAAFRALGAVERSLLLLDPEADMVAMARAVGPELMGTLTSPSQLKLGAERQLAALAPLLGRLPRQLAKITEQLETGTLTVRVRGLGEGDDERHRLLVQQLTLGLLASAIGLGGVLLLGMQHGPRFLPELGLWGFLGLTFLLFAFVLGARVLIDVFHRRAWPDHT